MKLINKITSLLIALSVSLCSFGVVFAEETENTVSAITETEITKKEAVLLEADALLSSLLGRNVRGTTRAGFISDVTELNMNITADIKVPDFNDVKIDRVEAPAIHTALSMGYISKGDTFRPDAEITFYEAVKVATTALGYEEYAKFLGGWPTGYVMAAEKAGLLEYVSASDEILSADDAKILLMNMLNANTVELTGNVWREVSDTSLLERRFSVYRTEGIVKETPQNSYYSSAVKKDRKGVLIGDVRYTAAEGADFSDLLGYHAAAYYNENDEIVSITKTHKNRTVSFSTEDGYLASNLVMKCYENDSSSEAFDLNGEYVFLYNKILSTKSLSYYSSNCDGIYTLVDNDNDEEFDVVNLQAKTYLFVSGVIRENELITDKNSKDNNLDLSDENGIYNIYDTKGNPKRLVDIKENETYEIYASEDKMLITAHQLSVKVLGKVTSVSDETIGIEGVEYDTTAYFDTNYRSALKAGDDGEFTFSSDNKLVSFLKSESVIKYGYIKNIYYDESGENVCITIFDEDEKFHRVSLADKVRVDGISTAQSGVYTTITQRGTNQLVRFNLNGDGEIAALDLADTINGFVEDDKPANNSLSECVFETSAYQFRDSINMMYPHFNLDGTKVFIIPNDLTKEEEYGVTNYSYFRNYTTYSGLKAYDVGTDGSAGVVIVRSNNKLPSLTTDSVSFVVEKVVSAYNEELDKVMPFVTGWEANKHTSYFIDDSLSLYKASGETLGFGDVVRYYAEDGIIKVMCCDFDANENVFAKNAVDGAVDFNVGYAESNYQFGSAYSVSGKYVYMSAGITDVFDTAALRNFVINTTNIALVDMENETIKTGTISDIKTAKAAGDDEADVLLIRQHRLGARACFVYKR